MTTQQRITSASEARHLAGHYEKLAKDTYEEAARFERLASDWRQAADTMENAS